MSKTVTVSYRTSPEGAEENVQLVEAVYAALARLQPSDFQYLTLRLADGVTFLHIAHIDGEENPLTSLPEFAEFQRELPSAASSRRRRVRQRSSVPIRRADDDAFHQDK